MRDMADALIEEGCALTLLELAVVVGMFAVILIGLWLTA